MTARSLSYLSQKATKILDKLTADLSTEKRSKVIKNNETFMPVHVELISCASAKVYSVTHYYEQNGDLVTDPEMTFLKTQKITKKGDLIDAYIPLSIEHGGRRYDKCADFDGEKVERFWPRSMRDQANFGNEWMNNIKLQQKL